MKFRIIFLMLLSILLVASCNKSDEMEEPMEEACVDLDGDIVTFTSGGDAYSFKDIVAFTQNFYFDFFYINSSCTTVSQVSNFNISLVDPEVGTRMLDAQGSDEAVISWSQDLTSNAYDSYEGSITLTEYDETTGVVKGTFTAKLRNDDGVEIEVTNGKIDVLIQ